METPDEAIHYFRSRWTHLVSAVALTCDGIGPAEDAVQEAMARLWLRWEMVRPEARDAWLYRVAVNLSRSRWRSRKREAAALERSRSSSTSDPRPGDARRVEDQAQIDQLLQGLSGRQREALVRFYILDEDVETISNEMRCSVGTIRSHLARGLEKTREGARARDAFEVDRNG